MADKNVSGPAAGPVAALRTIFVFMQGRLVLELDRRGCRQLSTQQTRFRVPPALPMRLDQPQIRGPRDSGVTLADVRLSLIFFPLASWSDIPQHHHTHLPSAAISRYTTTVIITHQVESILWALLCRLHQPLPGQLGRAVRGRGLE